MQVQEIRRLLENDQLIIGHNQAKQAIVDGTAKQLLVASNAPQDAVMTISSAAKMADVEVVTLEMLNQDLGTACRKGFAISFIAVKQ